ncbi:MAG: tetratricopeptide repeat protein [Bacteroidota bacterium]
MSTERIKILEQYLMEEPDDAFTLYALALEYAKIQAYNSANNYFSTLVNKHPDYLPAYYHFGKSNEMLDEKEKANQLYLKGIELAKNQNDRHTLKELQQAFNSLNGIEEDGLE